MSKKLAPVIVFFLMGVSAAIACPDDKDGEAAKTAEIDRPVAPGVKVVTASFAVKGMHCEGCAEHVKAALAKAEGIYKVTVKVADHRVVVSYDAKKISTEKIAKMMADAGYDASAEA